MSDKASNAPTPFDFWYAVNNTRIVLKPKRHLETFGNTLLNYVLVSEMMDSVNQIRIREGRMQAAQPQIIAPQSYSKMMLEGFGEEAEQYANWLREHEQHIHILRYGYTLRQESLRETVVTDSLEAVLARVKTDYAKRQDPFRAVVQGVDTPWDVCLVKLFWQVIQESVVPNVREMAQRNLLERRDGIPLGVREAIEADFSEAQQDPAKVQPLGRKLQDQGLFEYYQDRFFALVRSHRGG